MSNLNNIQSALALCEKSIELDRCIDDIKPIAIVEDIQYKRDQTSIDVVVYSLGCKTNQCEGEALVAQFGKIGIRASDLMQVASVYIINTCSVTVEADRKSRQVCRRAKSLNPNAVVYVCGCAVANCKDEYFAGAKVIAGAIDKNHIVSTIVNMHSFEHNSHFNSTVSKKVVNKVKRARKHIKIQDGCNDFCSFCIIPYLRGRSKSRDVIDIANDVLQANTNEIVLTGINITAYGRDNNSTLAGLVERIQTDARIRLSSIECNAIDVSLLDAMVRNNGCNHFHLSLQSGSDKVLRAMNRKYTIVEFEDKVELIRRIMGDNSAITTDIIVGYPTETEHDFENTLDIVDRVGFSDVHSFKFSPRPSTVASRLPQLPKSIVDERFERLQKRIEYNRQKFLTKQVGLIHEVVFENASDGSCPSGYTRNYCKVVCDNAQPNSISTVKIVKIEKDWLVGELITKD